MTSVLNVIRPALAAVSLSLWVLLPPVPLHGAPAFPSVVVLNSYHDGFVWSDEEQQGLTARLRETYPGLDPRIEYLDAKRFASQDRLDQVRDFLVRKYAGFKADLVVALDNPALEMLLANHEQLFPGAPIVFAGVSDFSSLTVPAGVQVTGVAEVTNLAGTVRIALTLHPDAREMLLVSDTTPSGAAVQRESEIVMAQFRSRLRYRFLPPSTFEEAAQRISRLPPDALLMILSYATDRTGRSLSLAESTRLFTNHCPVPAYALHETRLGFGVVGGMMLSGTVHGRRAGDLALRVLSGQSPSKVPVDFQSTSVPLFDNVQLQRFHIPPALLPSGSTIINKPETVFSEYPLFSGIMTGIVTVLIALACLLTASIFRRRETERELRASQANLRALLETTDDSFCSRDRQGRLIAFNASFARTLHDFAGIDVRPGMRYSDFLQPEGRQALEALTERCFTGGKVSDVYELKIQGERRVLEISVYPIREGREAIGTVEFARDITEKKQAEKTLRESEEQLLQARKMEAVGRLAGGITHDFNNLLTVIKAYSDMAMESRGEGEALLEDLKQIQSAVTRAASLTSQLLAFSRRQVREPRVFNVNDLIREMARMLVRVIGENIELCTSLQERLWDVRADAAQVQQIIMNLVLNARDAMSMGGMLTITTENADNAAASTDAGQDGNAVVLTISDTGRGMDEETLSHLFEPFFTTKEAGKGTGLGLSTVYGFVKQSGGRISCASKPGEGTTFRIILPRAEKPEEKSVTTESAGAGARAKGAILVVEDEEAVRSFIVRTLSSAGYTVTEAVNGAAALETLRGNGSAFDLIVSDVVMPLMGGPELARRAGEEFPRLKVLFISGYVGESLSAQGVLEESACILKKPFGPRELLDAVQKALGTPWLDSPHHLGTV